MASETPEEEAEMLLGLKLDKSWTSLKSKEKGYKGSCKDFLNRTKADKLIPD